MSKMTNWLGQASLCLDTSVMTFAMAVTMTVKGWFIHITTKPRRVEVNKLYGRKIWYVLDDHAIMNKENKQYATVTECVQITKISPEKAQLVPIERIEIPDYSRGGPPPDPHTLKYMVLFMYSSVRTWINLHKHWMNLRTKWMWHLNTQVTYSDSYMRVSGNWSGFPSGQVQYCQRQSWSHQDEQDDEHDRPCDAILCAHTSVMTITMAITMTING